MKLARLDISYQNDFQLVPKKYSKNQNRASIRPYNDHQETGMASLKSCCQWHSNGAKRVSWMGSDRVRPCFWCSPTPFSSEVISVEMSSQAISRFWCFLFSVCKLSGSFLAKQQDQRWSHLRPLHGEQFFYDLVSGIKTMPRNARFRNDNPRRRKAQFLSGASRKSALRVEIFISAT